jgi:hypothetical protein
MHPARCLLAEAGGSVLHLNGSAYTLVSTDPITVCATTSYASASLRQWLIE